MRAPRWILGASLALAATACDDTHPAPSAPGVDPTLSLAGAEPGVRVYQFRTVEDPDVSGATTFCAGAPFTVNVRLNASVYVENARGSDALVVSERADPIGTALACAQITDPTFPTGLQQKFYAQFNLPSGSFTANGTCTLISNNVPQAGLVLAGCTLGVIQAPEGIVGGAATSLSVFLPRPLAGFSTGSRWTIQLYESAP
jgi:hypothetical protein